MNANAMARGLVGVVLILVGIAAGLYAGLWWAFIGGIVQVVDAVKASPTDAWGIAYGAARIVFAGFIGGVSAILLIVPGAALVKSA